MQRERGRLGPSTQPTTRNTIKTTTLATIAK